MSGVFVHVRPPLACPLLAAALLSGALVWLEFHKLFSHVVVVALREDPQDRQARLVHVHTPAKRHPAGDAALVGYVLHLQHGHAHGAVLPGEAVILHAHLQLVALRTHLSAQRAGHENNSQHFLFSSAGSCRRKELDTHYWKLSLNLGDQLLFLDLVANFLFLSLRWGPMMKTSTKGLKPCAFHFRSLAATTGLQSQTLHR